jgi:hypothetical protein
VNERLQRMWLLLLGIGKPHFDIGNDHKIYEADRTIAEINKERQELEARLRLLEIQGTPRGPMNG